jgi:polysaccharide pyruvyl transferase WcaK-like protein
VSLAASPYHVALWGAWYGSRNVGDQAILGTLPPILEAAVGEPVRFTVFTDDARWVAEYGPRESGCAVAALQNRRQLPRVLATLARCDLFVIGGGVPFYEQTYHLAVMATLVGTARLAGTPYMTWSVAAQEVRRRAAHRLFRWVLDGAAAVTCRDARSEAVLRASGTRRPIQRAADPVFRIAWGAAEEERAAEVLAAAGVAPGGRPPAALACRRLRSGHRYAAEHYDRKAPRQVERTLACFGAALDRLWEAGLTPVFVPMNTVAPDDDREMARQVAARARHGRQARFVDAALRPAETAALLALCRVAVTSRLHAAVLAAVAGVPAAIHAIGPKLAGMAGELGLEEWMLEDAAATPEATAAAVGDLLARLPEVRPRLAERVVELRRDALLPGHLAAELLRRGRAAAAGEAAAAKVVRR